MKNGYPKNEDILSPEQNNNALIFYHKHQSHIEKLIIDLKIKYEPSQIEDKNDPRIWKAEYWKWFLENNPQMIIKK